jgi:hypothetical protein
MLRKENMENVRNEEYNSPEASPSRRPYRAPELVSLGEIQSIIQIGCHPGNDTSNFGMCSCAS